MARRKNLKSFLIVLVLSGSGVLMYDQKLYELKKGSCFFIDCMTPYYHQSSSTDPWELVWVHFDGCTSEAYYRYFSANSLPAFSPAAFPELREKFSSLLDVNTASDFQAEIASSRLIVDILSILLQEITGSGEEKSPGHQKMAEVRKFLDEHYTEKFSLDELSRPLFLSANIISPGSFTSIIMSP